MAKLKRPSRVSLVMLCAFFIVLSIMRSPPSFFPAATTSKASFPLLGLLVVGKADVFTIKDWLHRHDRMFKKLVIVDGSYSDHVKNAVLSYDNTVLLPEDTLNITHINDQTLRAPAMQALGNPIGSWIMVCHADEFWTIDPRRLVQENVREDPKRNLIRLRVLTASPLESEYKKWMERVDKDAAIIEKSFHIMQVSNLTNNKAGPSGMWKMDYYENRFFRWEKGMSWGDRHSLVVPEHNPQGYRRGVMKKAFYVHFKLHDFSMSGNGYHFANSQLITGLHNHSSEGWMGTFMDETFPEELKRYPPRSLEAGLQEACEDLADPLWPCELPWTVEASFT